MTDVNNELEMMQPDQQHQQRGPDVSPDYNAQLPALPLTELKDARPSKQPLLSEEDSQRLYDFFIVVASGLALLFLLGGAQLANPTLEARADFADSYNQW